MTAVVLVLQLWQANPRVPFAYSGDVNVNSTVIKGIIETGWYERIPSLGAPAGYDMHDFPLGGDNLQLVLLKGMTLFSHDWALILNAYYLLTFALVAAISYLVFRRLGLARWLALGLGTIFTLLPYHFIPGEQHLLLSGYLVVPLGALLVLAVFSGGLHGRAGQAGSPSRPWWRMWIWPTALCVLIGCGGSYYAFFTVMLLGVAGAFALLSAATRRGALHAVVLMAIIVGVGAFDNLPSLLYWRAHGHNNQVAQRALGESDLYALHVVDLFLPLQNHRLPPLAALKAKRDAAALVPVLAGGANTPVGVATATGLVVSLLGVAAMALDDRFGGPLRTVRARFAQLGIINAACLLSATIGGFSLLIAMAGFVQIRVWARIVVFIAFFSLLALGMAVTAGVEALGTWLSTRRPERDTRRTIRRVGLVGAPVLLCLAVLDQTTPAMVPPYAANRISFSSDKGFVQAIEQLLPKHAAVFQLPIVSYPERPAVIQMADYDLFRGYLQSSNLRWSYGAMRGRPSDWTPDLAGRPLADLLDRVTAAGFDGLYIDRYGFADHATQLEIELTRLIGPAALFSRDGRMSFFDLRAHAAAQRTKLGPAATASLGDLVLHPVTATWDKRFYPLTFSPPYSGTGDALYYPEQPGQSTSRQAQADASVRLVNPLASARPVRLTFSLASPTGVGGVLTVAGADAQVVLAFTPDTTPAQLSVVLPPGTSTLSFHCTIPAGPGQASFRLDNFRIDDTAPPTSPK